MTSVLKENMKGIEERAKAIDKSGEADRRFANKQETMAFQAQRSRPNFKTYR